MADEEGAQDGAQRGVMEEREGLGGPGSLIVSPSASCSQQRTAE